MLFDGLLLACCLLVCLVPSTTLPQTISTFFTTSHIRQFFWRTFLFGEHSFLANIPFWRTFLFGEHSFLANIPFWRTFSIDDVVKKIEMVLNGVGYGTLKQQEAISINQ
jgi:hypothetical protein